MGQETQIPDHEDRVAAGQCPSLADRSLNYSTCGSETASCLERKGNEIPETQSTKVNPKCIKKRRTLVRVAVFRGQGSARCGICLQITGKQGV